MQSWTKYLRQTLVFVSNKALQKKSNLYFSKTFCQYLKNFSFWREDRMLGLNSKKFRNFLDIN